MAHITLHEIRKAYGRRLIINDLTCQVTRGEALCIYGPSGCGKTTILRLIAGLERLDSGVIEIDGKPVSNGAVHVAPAARGVAMAFQDLALWPHLSVRRQLDFVLRGIVSNLPERRRELLDLVDLSGLENELPRTLSGGEQQRLAIARALAQNAPVLLLDEAFSSLDPARFERIAAHLDTLKTEGRTLILATHNPRDVERIADRILMMDEGHAVRTPKAFRASL